jgi:hypothetical protein
MSEPTGPTEEQLRAVNEAQTPAEYAAAAQAAGLTTGAEEAAAAGAAPVQVPDFAELVRQMQADNAEQIAALEASFKAQLDSLKAGIPAPAVDPKIPVARNLSASAALFANAYPNASRLEPLKEASTRLAAAVAEPGPDDPPAEVPDPALVGRVITTLRRAIAANPQLETGILEHIAQGAEDLFEL